MFTTIKNKFIGNKAFYKMVLAVAVPIMIQNGITNFVSMLDNIMIGLVGTEQMSGVSIVNQLMFVFNLCIFGGFAGAGIFASQFYGIKDFEGVRQTFRYKLLMGILLVVGALLIFVFFDTNLINLYLNGESQNGNLESTLFYGKQYLFVMLFGLPAFMITQVYVSTLRECGETLLPMKAGLIAVVVNLVFNYLLIYGKFFFPCLGVQGAAIATVISRYVELLIVVIWSHTHTKQNEYLIGLYKSFKLPIHFAKKIFVKGFPLLLNETLWASGIATLVQCYSIRGLDVIAGLNIANTINNVFNVVFIALGCSVGIIIGQLLGAGKMEEAKSTDRKMIAFSVFCCIIMSILLIIVAPFFPKIYNTTQSVRKIAFYLILIQAIFMPQNAFLHASYFTLRSGGKTLITFLFDGGYMWFCTIPIAFCLSRFTSLSIIQIFICVQISDWIKCITGFILVKKGIWLNNMVSTS